MARKYTLAVLECDTPIKPVVDKLGTYGPIFNKFVRRGLEGYTADGGAEKIDLKVLSIQAVDQEPFPDLGEVDCLMLTGSKHNSFDDHPWIVRLVEYVKEAYEKTNIALVGICFGHQIIARALGAEVRRNAGAWEVSVDLVKLTPDGQKIFGVDNLSLHQMHQDIVAELPKGATNLGSSPVCEQQGFYIPDRVLTLQAHPEFSEFIMQNILKARQEQSVFNDEVFSSGMERSAIHHDGTLVSKVIWKFLLGDL